MSLRNLQKSKPSANASHISVDEFIDGAMTYSAGLSGTCVREYTQSNKTLFEAKQLTNKSATEAYRQTPMHKASFTLDNESHNRLRGLSFVTGFSMSRLLRIMIHNNHEETCKGLLNGETVR